MKIKTEQQTVKGYKAFNSDLTCRGFQFEENKEFKMKETPVICKAGFHFCTKLSDCYQYYSFNKETVICEVEALGVVVTHDQDTKVATNHLKIGKRLNWEETMVIANEGDDNTGYRNTGNRNTGYRNTGDRNTGNWNTGNRNTGDSNTGDRNTGYRNTGDRNTGNRNTGYSNTGNWNTGNWNTGDSNTGNWNTGDRNTGDWNTGNWNTGYSNTGNWNTGGFNTETPKMTLFNKPSNWTFEDFEKSAAYDIMRRLLDTKIWIPAYQMSDEEKTANKSWQTVDGYLKTISIQEAWKNMWGNLDNKSKQAFFNLPNFEWSVFTEITGIEKG